MLLFSVFERRAIILCVGGILWNAFRRTSSRSEMGLFFRHLLYHSAVWGLAYACGPLIGQWDLVWIITTLDVRL